MSRLAPLLLLVTSCVTAPAPVEEPVEHFFCVKVCNGERAACLEKQSQWDNCEVDAERCYQSCEVNP